MSNASTVPIIAALREVQRGYLVADRLMGGLSVLDAIRTQIPVVEKVCEVTRGADRSDALEFACRFMEFCGWVHHDAGDLPSAMFWTDRAFDYAMELGDQRTIAYTLMRKSAIATEAGNPAQGLGITNFALSNSPVLTPRLRAVILRQRAHAHAALHETAEVERDADNALAEAAAGISQGEEEDRAPYCSPMYVAMEAGQSMVVAGQPEKALAVLAKSHAEWSDRAQTRDYAMCVSRFATAYAAAGEPEEACKAAGEAVTLAYGIGSRRFINQLGTLLSLLGKWRNDPVIIPAQRKLGELVFDVAAEIKKEVSAFPPVAHREPAVPLAKLAHDKQPVSAFVSGGRFRDFRETRGNVYDPCKQQSASHPERKGDAGMLYPPGCDHRIGYNLRNEQYGGINLVLSGTMTKKFARDLTRPA